MDFFINQRGEAIASFNLMPSEQVEMQPLKVDQRWYITLQGETIVQEVTVLEMTSKTILLRFEDLGDLKNYGIDITRKVRYTITSITFLDLLPMSSNK